jgi:predicted nucleic acid-binding protein
MASIPSAPSARIFIDSSVSIAAAISAEGSARDLPVTGMTGRCELVTSQFVLTECERNIARKAPAALTMFRAFTEALAADLVEPSRETVLEAAQIVEAKDASVVAGTAEAGADYLATYDRRHLLPAAERIREVFGAVAATPAEILALIQSP